MKVDPDHWRTRHWGDGENGLSKTAAAFASGILDHAPAVLAFTAPSVVSYHRLGPGHWSADSPRLAVQDREALLRIPGPAATTGAAAHPHLEFRAADSTDNPWLALAALGPSRPGRSDRRRLRSERSGFPAEPRRSRVSSGTRPRAEHMAPADLLCIYLSLKRAELAEVAQLSPDDLYERYAHAY
jgi:glutamine synthetase